MSSAGMRESVRGGVALVHQIIDPLRDFEIQVSDPARLLVAEDRYPVDRGDVDRVAPGQLVLAQGE